MSSHLLLPRLGATLLLAAVAGSAVGDDSLEQLRAENARLRAQLQQLQQSCPAAASAAASAAAAASVVSAAAPAPAAAPSATPPSAAAAAVQVQAPARPAAGSPPSVASAAVPAGYKLVPLTAPDYVDPLAPPYDRTGCSRDLFKGPPPARWNDLDNWSGLGRGQSMAEVEKQLGKEHYDASGRGRIEWQYGKCGDIVRGRVQFESGQVVSWQVPDL
jgi:hypothetical protein